MTETKSISAGQVYCFPLIKLASPYEETGYWGACKVLRVDKDGAVIAGLDWAGREPLLLENASGLGILDLIETTPDKPHAIYWRELNNAPENFKFIGLVEPTDVELGLLECHCETRHCTCIKMLGGWKALRAGVNREWRKRLDPDAYELERAWLIAQMKSNKSQNADRQKGELAKVSLNRLSKKVFFSNWETNQTPDLLLASREIIVSTLKELSDIEKSSDKNRILKILQECVEGFNRLNQKHGFINTAKREDICFEIDRISKAMGIQESNIADKWREW